VNGNDAPTGGYVDEFDLEGRLVARVAQMDELNEPWGLAFFAAGPHRWRGASELGVHGLLGSISR